VNPAPPGFGPRRGHVIKLNPATPGLGVNMSLGRCQVDVSASGFEFRRTAKVTQPHAAAAGRNLHFAVALPPLHTAPAGLDGRALGSGLDLYAAAAGFCHDLAVGVPHFDRPSASVQVKLATHVAYIDRSAPGFGVRASANVIELHAAAATLRFHPASDSRSVHIAALGFELEQRHIARNHHRKFSGESARPPPPLPVANDPGSLALHICGNLILLELAACILLGRIAEMSMNHVIDALL